MARIEGIRRQTEFKETAGDGVYTVISRVYPAMNRLYPSLNRGYTVRCMGVFGPCVLQVNSLVWLTSPPKDETLTQTEPNIRANIRAPTLGPQPYETLQVFLIKTSQATQNRNVRWSEH